MAYSEFSLAKAKQDFSLSTLEKRNIFAGVSELTASNLQHFARLTSTVAAVRKIVLELLA